SIDIQDFFPSISQSQVVDALRGLGYAEHSANLIAGLCCLDRRLPQGSPASPVLSNVVFAPTDSSLSAFCLERNISYTRYADDLVFSGQGEMPRDCAQSVSSIVIAAGWTIASRKTRWSCRPSRLKVHGLLVQEELPKLTRGYRNKIRAYAHMLSTGKVRESDAERLRGHVSLARHIELRRRALGKETK
ncbi:MAG: hypothetical protein GJU76_15815, partial [Gallionella sp.]|nr:hypothetical protein [Gallionella sp.]